MIYWKIGLLTRKPFRKKITKSLLRGEVKITGREVLEDNLVSTDGTTQRKKEGNFKKKN